MTNRINKISDIKKEITCPHCLKGTRKLKSFYVHPKSGRVGIYYSWCSRPFCSGEHSLMQFTDIIIPELKIGDNND